MGRDIETFFEELENMMNDEYVREKVSDLKQKTLQAIATARAEVLREAADRAEVHVMTNTVGCLDLQGLRQAIIADKQWEPQ